MDDDTKIWVYPQNARRVSGHYEMPGSRRNERVNIVLDRDVTPFISARDPRAAPCEIRRELHEAAQLRLRLPGTAWNADGLPSHRKDYDKKPI